MGQVDTIPPSPPYWVSAHSRTPKLNQTFLRFKGENSTLSKSLEHFVIVVLKWALSYHFIKNGGGGREQTMHMSKMSLLRGREIGCRPAQKILTKRFTARSFQDQTQQLSESIENTLDDHKPQQAICWTQQWWYHSKVWMKQRKHLLSKQVIQVICVIKESF